MPVPRDRNKENRVMELRRQGMSYRKIAQILSISFQRVHQIVARAESEAKKEPPHDEVS